MQHMHLYLSANAAKSMKISDFTPNPDTQENFSVHWYIHCVTIMRRKHLIAMEAQSRYAIIFCGAKKPLFNAFPAILTDYLWRHIVSLCEVDDADFGHIKLKIANRYKDITYHKGLSRSVQSHIKDAFVQLEWDLHRYGFPDNPGEEFKLSMAINNTPRTRFGEKNCILPFREFQRQWCEILKVAPVSANMKHLHNQPENIL